ncbi:MAG: tRNA dimethylallyltransferase, partial [Actinomycetota bacterium]
MIAIVGATATGKSSVAMCVARAFEDVEIVSLDSMQVYRGLDIGTAKPTVDERAEVRHHLLDIADLDEEMSVADIQRAAREAIADIDDRGAHALLVGGTGLYVRAVLDDLELPGQFPDVRRELEADVDTDALQARLSSLDPDAAARIPPGNRRRVVRALEVTLGSGRPFSSYGPGLAVYPPSTALQVGIELSLDELDRRIEARVRGMLDDGFVEEVAGLQGRPRSRTAAVALGYDELEAHLAGDLTLDEALAAVVTRTRQLARRQRRWFRRDPRIVWTDSASRAA